MRKQILGMMLCACVCVSCDPDAGGVFEPVEPPVEKPETPTTPPSTEDLLTIKIEDDIMAVVGTNTWNAIAYGNGKYVAVGTSGYVTTSTDGINWTPPKRAGTEEWFGIVYGKGKYVAVGQKNVAISTNGIDWTVYSNVSSSYLLSIAYGNEKFVMVGSDSYIGVSTDGQNWTNITNVNAGYLWDVIYANGKFRAVGMEGYYATSIDGITWDTNRLVQTSYAYWRCVACNNVNIVVGTDYGIICFTDADLKPQVIQPLYPGYSYMRWADIVYSNGVFIAIGNTSISSNRGISCISISSDGISWSTPVRIHDENGNDLAYVCKGLSIAQ